MCVLFLLFFLFIFFARDVRVCVLIYFCDIRACIYFCGECIILVHVFLFFVMCCHVDQPCSSSVMSPTACLVACHFLSCRPLPAISPILHCHVTNPCHAVFRSGVSDNEHAESCNALIVSAGVTDFSHARLVSDADPNNCSAMFATRSPYTTQFYMPHVTELWKVRWRALVRWCPLLHWHPHTLWTRWRYDCARGEGGWDGTIRRCVFMMLE